MKMATNTLLMVLALNVLLAGGQILLKQAITATTPGAGMASLVRAFLVDWRAWTAVACTGSVVVLWLKVLAGAPLSIVYPMISISYAFGLLGAWLLLGEDVSLSRWVGVLLICAGCWLIGAK